MHAAGADAQPSRAWWSTNLIKSIHIRWNALCFLLAAGVAGTGGTGGTLEQTIKGLCERLDECNELEGISTGECVEIMDVCVDETFLTPSLQEDWAMLIEYCLQFADCYEFYSCWLEVPFC